MAHGSEKQRDRSYGWSRDRTEPNQGNSSFCGDSHTATYGAFGAIAFGIGTSEVEHVFATQTLWQVKPKKMLVEFTGVPQKGSLFKDFILVDCQVLALLVGVGYVVEYRGQAIRCTEYGRANDHLHMSIEFGPKMGITNPDQTTYDYLKGRECVPEDFEEAVADWKTIVSDDDAVYDKVIQMDVSDLAPMVTWGTNPADSGLLDRSFPRN